MIDENLLTAYRTAVYIVEYLDKEYQIQVGEKSDLINRLINLHKVQNAYFITPENPFSCKLNDKENALRHLKFRQYLIQHELSYLTGYGTDEVGFWPKEHSYLIFTDGHTSMHNLAIQFEQNAFLYMNITYPVQLYVRGTDHYVCQKQ